MSFVLFVKYFLRLSVKGLLGILLFLRFVLNLYMARLFPPIEIKIMNWKWKTCAERDMCQHLREIHTACGPTEFGLRRK